MAGIVEVPSLNTYLNHSQENVLLLGPWLSFRIFLRVRICWQYIHFNDLQYKLSVFNFLSVWHLEKAFDRIFGQVRYQRTRELAQVKIFGMV